MLSVSKCGVNGDWVGASTVKSNVGTTEFNSAILTYFSAPSSKTFCQTVESYPRPYLDTSV